MSNSRILVVAPAWIGDLIMSLSFLRALKNINKNSKIDLLVNEDLVDIVKYFPIISNIISSQTSHGKLSLLYRIKLGLKLRKIIIKIAIFYQIVSNLRLFHLSQE